MCFRFPAGRVLWALLEFVKETMTAIWFVELGETVSDSAGSARIVAGFKSDKIRSGANAAFGGMRKRSIRLFLLLVGL